MDIIGIDVSDMERKEGLTVSAVSTQMFLSDQYIWVDWRAGEEERRKGGEEATGRT